MLICRHHFSHAITDNQTWGDGWGLTLVLQVKHYHIWSPPFVIIQIQKLHTSSHPCFRFISKCHGNQFALLFQELRKNICGVKVLKICGSDRRAIARLLLFLLLSWKTRYPERLWLNSKHIKIIIFHLVNFNALTATANQKMTAVDLLSTVNYSASLCVYIPSAGCIGERLEPHGLGRGNKLPN